MNKKLMVSGVVASLLSTSGFAQIEEIVVTAQKREQSLQDVPIAITAFSSSDVERLNAADVSDLQYSTPNLFVGQNSRSVPKIGLRGISDQSRNPGYDNRVSVYVDGMYVGRSGASNQSTLDLERIEVLRGPQGTLFGKNTVAGAISMTTKKPVEVFSGFIEAEVGNYDRLSVTGMVNGALIEDRLFAKLLLNDTQRDGHLDNLSNGKDLNGLDQQNARLQLRWLAGSATEMNFYIESSDNAGDYVGAEAVPDMFAGQPYTVNIDADTISFIEQFGTGLNIEHELDNEFTLTAISGYRESDSFARLDEDYSPFPIAVSNTREKSDHFSQELRLSSPATEDYDYVIGLYYFDQTNESASSGLIGPAGPAAGLPANTRVDLPGAVDVHSFAIFSHGNYRINEQLEITAGLRYTYEKKEVAFSITDTSGLFASGSFSDERSASNWSPKLGLNYTVGEDLMVYGSYAKGFKSGGWNIDFLSSFDNIDFDDEEVDSFELGIKSTLADGRVRLNAALFHADYSNYQVFQFVPQTNGTTLFTLTNAGEVTSRGVEMDINWAVTDAVSLWASYGYTDAVFEKFKNGGGAGIDFDDNKAPDAPENNVSIGVEYRHSLADLGDLILQLDYSYRDQFYTHPNNFEVNRVESYDLVNGRIGIESDDGVWSVFAWAKNLTDNQEINNRNVSFFGIARASYTEPRTYGVSLKYHFGAL